MVNKFKELVLKNDTTFNESIEVETSITCKENNRFSLKVKGNIDAGDINAGNIDAGNINAWNINAWDINAGNINAGDIDAGDIICEKRIKKETTNKTFARIFIQEKSKLKKKEWMDD